ncbi:MAG: hypothetical protein QM642_03425 [Edaphocola sp.]
MSDTLQVALQNAMLLGAIQGVIFSGFAFFSKKYKAASNYFLGMLILAFSYSIIQNYLSVSGLFSRNQLFAFFYIPLSTVFMPLYFLYVKHFLYQKQKMEKQDYWLFIPFLITLVESIFEKLGFALGIFNGKQYIGNAANICRGQNRKPHRVAAAIVGFGTGKHERRHQDGQKFHFFHFFYDLNCSPQK